MAKDHLKRLNAPNTWLIHRKERKWIVRPKSSHPMQNCMPLAAVLTEVLKLVKTGREARTVLNQKLVLVNKAVKKDPKLGVGLMDVLELPSLKKHYRVLLNAQGKLVFHEISEKDAELRPCKVTGKRIIAGKKVQLAFADGSSMIVEKDVYKVGDTVVVEMPSNKVKEHLKFEKGALVYLTAGNQVSMTGSVEDVKSFKGTQPDNVILSSKGKSFETRKAYAMVIGKDKPVIQLVE